MDDTQSLAARIRAVYEQVWHEFFDWEREYCLLTLASLTPTTLVLPSDGNKVSLGDENISSEGATYDQINCAEVCYFVDGEVNHDKFSCPTYSCGTMDPAQPFEACTYTKKNIYIADDQCEAQPPFIPFSDDPRFPTREFLDCYDSNEWKAPKRDPDHDMITAEAVRRLHYRFGVSFGEIDETRILPMVITERSDQRGLLHLLNERDLLDWPGAINSDLPPLPYTAAPLPTSLRKRVNGIRYLFCANLNCVEPYCPTHLNLDEKFKKSMNLGTHGDEEGYEAAPCGDDCYKHGTEDIGSLGDWDAETVDELSFILEGAADLSSCDLAIVCDKPCREIYAHRRVYNDLPKSNSPNEVASASSYDPDSISDEKLVFDDGVRGPNPSDALPPSEICQHLGECNSKTNCKCYRKNLHCHRNCRCDLSCHRRPRGCWCKNHQGRRCGTYKCPCYKAGRECDPELCQKCGAKNEDVKMIGGCRNNGLQHGVSKALEVKQGSYGLGLFLREDIREGDLIGEYVGEILSDKMADARGVVTRHLGRNYLFGLNGQWTIDAGVAGNEMRFVNHASGNLANCRAEVREVNGDHRIGIYAAKRVTSGQELFMDYGKEYFTDSGGMQEAGRR